MEVEFKDKDLDRLETDLKFHGGYGEAVVKAYRKRMQMIRAATDEQTFRGLRSVRYEKLKGKRNHQRSMRLNDQWRLIIEIENQEDGKHIAVVAIEDYH